MKVTTTMAMAIATKSISCVPPLLFTALIIHGENSPAMNIIDKKIVVCTAGIARCTVIDLFK